MVEIKNGYLYMLHEDSGKITCEECELYFFGSLDEERHLKLAIDVPRRKNWRFNSIFDVDALEYETFYFGYQSEGYVMLWCFERNDNKAKEKFIQKLKKKINDAKWEIDGYQHIMYMTQVGEGITMLEKGEF